MNWLPRIIIAWFVISIFGGALIAFMIEHGRFPMGSGEVWNWLLGIG